MVNLSLQQNYHLGLNVPIPLKKKPKQIHENKNVQKKSQTPRMILVINAL
jgi:hypothetical protein